MRRLQSVARVVVCLVVNVNVLAMPALAQDCPELVGLWPGFINAVAVSGDYAYLGASAQLLVTDVSVPAAPRPIGQVSLPDEVKRVAVSDGYAYVADGGGGLRVVDISTPSAPVEVGSAPVYALDVAV